jgi:spore coat polysaccharide biosynthesis protein SpsF
VPSLDGIVVATTTNPSDDIVEQLTNHLGVGCFRGSEEDVLNRVLSAAKKFHCDVIVEITGDCPLIDPQIVEKILKYYLLHKYDYVSNVLKATYPNGMDTQVFSTEVLEKVSILTEDPIDHEHVSLFIYEHPERFSLYNIESDLEEKYQNIRLTVDTQEDFEFIRIIYEKLYPKNPEFCLKDILELLEDDKKLLNINKHVSQKRVR